MITSVDETKSDKWLAVCRAVLSAGGEMWATGVGHSMSPTIVDGERVLLGPPPAQLRRGMIVVVERDQTFAVHRLVRATPAAIQTKGDNRERLDAVISRTALVGRAIAKEHDGVTVTFVPTIRFGIAALARYLALEATRLARNGRRRMLRISRAGDAPA
jgi:hypothetical protein